MAAAGSVAMPTLEAKSFPEPTGTLASSGRRSGGRLISPLMTSLAVPSPPMAATTSKPWSAASLANSAACIGCSVEAHSHSPKRPMMARSALRFFPGAPPVSVWVEDQLDATAHRSILQRPRPGWRGTACPIIPHAGHNMASAYRTPRGEIAGNDSNRGRVGVLKRPAD